MNIYLRATTETALTCPTAAAQKRHVISFLEVWWGGVGVCRLNRYFEKKKLYNSQLNLQNPNT